MSCSSSRHGQCRSLLPQQRNHEKCLNNRMLKFQKRVKNHTYSLQVFCAWNRDKSKTTHMVCGSFSVLEILAWPQRETSSRGHLLAVLSDPWWEGRSWRSWKAEVGNKSVMSKGKATPLSNHGGKFQHFIDLFLIYLYLAASGLGCTRWIFVVSHRVFIPGTQTLVVLHRLRVWGAQQLWHTGLVVCDT